MCSVAFHVVSFLAPFPYSANIKRIACRVSQPRGSYRIVPFSVHLLSPVICSNTKSFNVVPQQRKIYLKIALPSHFFEFPFFCFHWLTLRWTLHARYELTQNGVGFDNWDVLWAETKHYLMHIANLVSPFILLFQGLLYFSFVVYCFLNLRFSFLRRGRSLCCNCACLQPLKALRNLEPFHVWLYMKAVALYTPLEQVKHGRHANL